MDTHEIDRSEHLDYLETVESTFTSTPVAPPWEKKKPRKWWSSFQSEFHNVIDNPKRMPTLLQPLISKDRAFTFGQEYPSYLNFKIHVNDEHGVNRRLYLHICQENLIVGGVGAVLVGVGTNHFKLSESRIQSFMAQRMLLGKPVAAVTRMALSGSLLAGSLCGKLIIRAITGGILYDVIKRSRDENRMDKTGKVMNSGLAGGICGLLFGLRGGLPFAWMAALITSAGSAASEFVTIPKIFTTSERALDLDD